MQGTAAPFTIPSCLARLPLSICCPKRRAGKALPKNNENADCDCITSDHLCRRGGDKAGCEKQPWEDKERRELREEKQRWQQTTVLINSKSWKDYRWWPEERHQKSVNMQHLNKWILCGPLEFNTSGLPIPSDIWP